MKPCWLHVLRLLLILVLVLLVALLAATPSLLHLRMRGHSQRVHIANRLQRDTFVAAHPSFSARAGASPARFLVKLSVALSGTEPRRPR